LTLLAAALAAGIVGALVALPAIRLSGIYLALTTAAFAVILDRWVFHLPAFSVFGHDVDLIQSGSLIMRPDVLGISLDGDRAYFIYGSVLFGALSLLVVALRRSTFGQRLIAIKEGPAAVATLGIDVNRTKLTVFALSAALAGIGGAVLAGANRTADPSTFDFFSGLPVLLTMVIAGISAPGAAIFTGAFLGTPLIGDLISWWAQVQSVLIGFAGVGLGRNPNGFLSELRPFSTAVRRKPAVLGGLAAVLVGIWLLRINDVIANPGYTLLSLLALPVAAFVALRVDGPLRDALPADVVLPGSGARDARLSAPPELLGVTEPFTPEDVAALDEMLGLAQAAGRADAHR
jgi:branched-chain amino acid transport system permease protein